MDTLNTEDWEVVKSIQKMWLGKIDGCFVEFKIRFEDFSALDSSMSDSETTISVFTEAVMQLKIAQKLPKNWETFVRNF